MQNIQQTGGKVQISLSNLRLVKGLLEEIKLLEYIFWFINSIENKVLLL